jgi:hypothetical protein
MSRKTSCSIFLPDKNVKFFLHAIKTRFKSTVQSYFAIRSFCGECYSRNKQSNYPLYYYRSAICLYLLGPSELFACCIRQINNHCFLI